MKLVLFGFCISSLTVGYAVATNNAMFATTQGFLLGIFATLMIKRIVNRKRGE